jgi:hypothetical protein
VMMAASIRSLARSPRGRSPTSGMASRASAPQPLPVLDLRRDPHRDTTHSTQTCQNDKKLSGLTAEKRPGACRGRGGATASRAPGRTSHFPR